jgi:hypothetical protein
VRQLNERLGQFIGLVEYGRTLDATARLARSIASLFNPILYPDLPRQLDITQEEIRASNCSTASHPSEPEYWWVYALLISSMIPSLVNLMIGGASFLRGVPGLPAALLGFLPVGKAVPNFDRVWIALVLTAQTFLGAIFGIVAQAFLAIVIIGYVLPWLGIEILDTARQVADFHLPELVRRIFSGA